MSRLVSLEMDPMSIPCVALSYEHRTEIFRDLARRYVENGRYHGETVKEASEQAVIDCKGIDEPFEIKKQFRHWVRHFEKLGRGGY